MTTPVLVAVGVLLLVAVIAVSMFNRLIALRNRFRNAYSQIDVQLKRRYDLIPNLVETSKAYLAHERGTLEAVISARNQAQSASVAAAANPGDPMAMRALSNAEAALAVPLSRLMAVAEAYPDLKGNQPMQQMMEELSSTENRVAFARQSYNDAVMEYNTSRESFPNVLIANSFGFGPADLFEIEISKEREAPKVAFS